MVRSVRVVLLGVIVSAFLTGSLGVPHGTSPAAASPPDPVQFSKPTFVDPPKTLLGDSGDGRCSDSTQPCFKDVDDLLFGRTHLLRTDNIVFGYQGAFGLFTSQNSTLTESNDKLFSLTDGTNRYTQPAVVGDRLR